MKKKVVSVLCVAMLMSVIAIPSMGAEATEDAQDDSAIDSEEQQSREEETSENLVSFDGPFEITDDEGRQVIGCEVSNAAEDTIYVGIVVEFFDKSGADIGIASAYAPCVATDEKAFIYVTNYFGEDYAEFSIKTTYGLSDYASAADDLSGMDILEDDDFLICTAENSSSETIYLPQITIVYTMDSEPASVSSGILKEDGDTELCLNGGQTGTADIACPEEYDDYEYYVTAIFDETSESVVEEEPMEKESEEADGLLTEIEGITLSFDGNGDLEACTIVDNDDISITVESFETDGSGNVVFGMHLENKTDDANLMFSADDVSVNNRMCDPFWAKSVAPGMDAYSELEFSKRVLDEAGINYISNIEMNLRVYNDDDWSADDYYNDIVILNVPNSSEDPMVYDIISENGYPETVLVDTGGVSVSVIDYSVEDGFNIYVENFSDQNIMVSADDVAVNGTMCDPFWAMSVPAGKSAYREMSWTSSKLEESKIDSIETVQMNLRIYDDDNWGSGDIFNGAVEFSAN